MKTVSPIDFWNMFYEKFNKHVKKYNFTKDTNSCCVETVKNVKYSIEIDYYTHPQFDEVELCVYIFDNITNNKLYKNKYLLINNADRTTMTLE